MAGGARRITVEFLGDDKSLGRTANQVDGKLGRLGSKMRTVGKVGAVALAAGVAIAGKAMWEMGKAAVEDEKSQALLATALRNTARATKGQIAQTEDWISAQGRALGITDDALRPALANLVRSTHDVGKAQKLAALAMDISAGTGKDLGAVSLALAKANNGNVAGLGRLGVKTKDAEGNTKSFTQVQKDLAKTFGGSAAKSAETMSGKMNRLSVMFQETKEAIGAKLLPIADKLATWFMKDGLPAIQKFGRFLSDELNPTFKDFSAFVAAKVVPVLKKLGDIFMKSILPAAIKLGGYITDRILPAVMDLGEAFAEALLPVLEKVGSFITDTLLPVIMKLADWITGDVVPVVKELAETLMNALGDAFSNIADHLKNLQPTFDLLIGALKGIWNVLKVTLIPVLKKAAEVIFPAIGTAIGAIIDVIGALSKAGIWMWNNVFQPVLKFFAEAISTVLNIWGDMLDILAKVPGFGWVGDIADGLHEASDAAGNVSKNIKKIDNAKAKPKIDVSSINHAITRSDTLLDYLKATGMVGGKPGKKPKNQPQVDNTLGGLLPNGDANGGRMWADTPRLVGENGPELFTPDSSGYMTPHHKLAASSSTSSSDFAASAPLVLHLDTKTVWQGLVKMKRTNGIVTLGLA